MRAEEVEEEEEEEDQRKKDVVLGNGPSQSDGATCRWDRVPLVPPGSRKGGQRPHRRPRSEDRWRLVLGQCGGRKL